MDSALWLGATAAKLSSVEPVGISIVAIGGVIAVAGWLWLIFQNARFGIIHGVLSLIPLYAVIYAFVGLEHRHKSIFTAACLGGALIAGVGYTLVYAAWDCEANDECGIRQDFTEEIEGGDEGEEGEEAGDGESSAVLTYQELGLQV